MEYFIWHRLIFTKERGRMAVYICIECGYEYNEDKEGTPFADLPDN